MKSTTHQLKIWSPAKDKAQGTRYTIGRLVTHPITLILATTLALALIVILDTANTSWVLIVPIFTAVLAHISILTRRKSNNRPLITQRQATKHNDFHYFKEYYGTRYTQHINTESERTENDKISSILLYQLLGEILVTLGFYEETGSEKITFFTGKIFDQVELIPYITDFILDAGVGYVLVEPPPQLIVKFTSLDEGVISHALRKIGYTDWTVERISYDDAAALFILRNESVSRAYNFSNEE